MGVEAENRWSRAGPQDRTKERKRNWVFRQVSYHTGIRWSRKRGRGKGKMGGMDIKMGQLQLKTAEFL